MLDYSHCPPFILRTTLAVLLGACCLLPAAAPDYPCWQGADGSASATAGVALADPNQARLAWVCEEKIPISYESGWSRAGWVRGGFASPVVADGRVYLYYFTPTGDKHGEGGRWKGEYGGNTDITLIDADDVALCVDAATGEVLWKRVMAGKATNWSVNAAGAPHLTPCVADGRVYVVGNMGRIYCLDAESGKTLWENDLGEWTAVWQAYEDYCLRTGVGMNHKQSADRILKELEKANAPELKALPNPGPNRGSPAAGLNFCPTVADGVLVVASNGGSSGLIGYDARTGKRLWTAGRRGTATSPISWRHGERTYILSQSTKLTAHDPRTGKELWTAATGRGFGGSPVVGEGYAVTRRGDTLTCLRLSPKGAKQVWQHENKTLQTSWTSMSIADGYLHYVVQLRHLSRSSEADVTDAMRDNIKRSGGGRKWSGLVSVELATGKIHRVYSGQDRNVNTVVADGLCFTDFGIYDIRDPKAARYLGDFTIEQGKRTVQLDQVGQGRGDHQLRGGGWVTPAYVGGRLYVRGFSPKEGCHRLFCLDFRR
ncbi:MAG: PQQ-binding-like beta-propeller repeat protein [Planctomycetota bacterium]